MLKNTVTETEGPLEEVNRGWMSETEEQISNLEEERKSSQQDSKKKKNLFLNEDSLFKVVWRRDLWENIKHTGY